MANMDVCSVDEQVAKRPKLDMDVSSDVATYFPQREDEVKHILTLLTLKPDGQPWMRFPLAVQEKIATMVYQEEQRSRMTKVLEQMDQLPKCKTCGSVSTLVSLFSNDAYALSDLSFLLFLTVQTFYLP